MIAAILSQMGTVVKTPGNRNSEIGLPLSLFSIDSDHQFGVFELGIGGKGEMDRLISVYSPDYGVMTNIGPAHIANFGSIEAIAQEKSKLFHPGIRRGYIYEHNVWKQYVNSLRNLSCREFGQEGTGGFCWAKPLGLDGWSICYEDRVFVLRHVGRHNLLNALAAVTIARDLGAEPHHIAAGLEALEPAAGRSRIVPGKVTVIEDSYNANTDSTGSIIDYMGGLSWKGRKAVVLGSMKELGETAERAHARIGRKVKTLAPSAAFLFGKEMESAYAVLRRSRSVGKLFFTESYEDLEREVTGYVREGDLLLLKGSRAMAMERLLKPLAMVS
jgi:UDP-N-acetylmuramoyl-tripeptide--D-alanyl-D-alanine ligase